MSFDFPSLLALLASGQGLALSIFLLTKRENRVVNRILSALLFVLAYILFNRMLWWTGLIRNWPGFAGTTFGVPLLYGPLMYLFYKASFEKPKLHYRDAVHFLPAGLAIIFMLPFYGRFFESLSFLNSIPMLGKTTWFKVLMFFQMAAYGIWIPIKFKKYFVQSLEFRKWHRLILVAYWGIVAAYLLYRLLSVFELTDVRWTYLIAGSLALFIYFIAWLGYIKPRVFSGTPLYIASNPVKYKKSSLTERRSKIIFEKIKKMMEGERIHHQDVFSLNKLASDLGEQRNHISQAVNEHADMSFPQFVNSYRVRDAQELLSSRSKKEMNVSEIAFAVGFRTLKSFNLAFKNITGMTPSEYRKLS